MGIPKGAQSGYITQDATGNYVLVGPSGARFSLSIREAIRLQKTGVPYKATPRTANPKLPSRWTAARVRRLPNGRIHVEVTGRPIGARRGNPERHGYTVEADGTGTRQTARTLMSAINKGLVLARKGMRKGGNGQFFLTDAISAATKTYQAKNFPPGRHR